MNVDWPEARSSKAPTRVKTRSTTPIAAWSAGTNMPHWAMTVIRATARMYVDLPAMFAPVMIRICSPPASRTVSFGTNGSLAMASTTGCLPPRIRVAVPSVTTGRV